jgi:Homeodomain-like domain
MLRELKVVEQRYQAVLQVLDGIPVTKVAERFGVARQSVDRWMARTRITPAARLCPVVVALLAADGGAGQFEDSPGSEASTSDRGAEYI